MPMQNQKLQKNKKIKKSHLLIFGSLLVFVGVVLLSYNHILKLRGELFSDMLLSMNEDNNKYEVPIANKVSNTAPVEDNKSIDYGKYLGVLTIPKIGLKRGFYNIDSRYNNIEYNVTLVLGSTMPDQGGNLILMAHSGDAYISYFEYLYRLRLGDNAYITYNDHEYKYKLVNVYDVPKVGQVTINRNYDKTTLTLITCTKNDSTKQTIYILELV